MAVLLTAPRIRFLDSNGAPLVGGKIYTYIAGTTTPQATYTNAGGLTPNSNPVILDSAGYADIWIVGSYKIVVHDSADNLISSTDNITGFTTGATGASFLDGAFTLQNSSDPTKQVVFNLAAIGSGDTVQIGVPNGNFTLVSTSLPQVWTAAQVEAVSMITYGPTITPDFSLGNNFQLQLAGNSVIVNPVNPTAGQSGNLYIYQDATGSRTITWGWGFINPGGSLPSLQSAGGALDILKYTITAYNSGTVTVSIATPGVVTFTNHGFLLGQQVQLMTTGALPTGLTVSTTFYVIPINANSFSLATSLTNAAAGTAINTTGSQSGIHTLTGLTIGLTTPKTSSSGGFRALSTTDTVLSSDDGKILQVVGTCALALTAAASIGNFSCYLENTATTGIQIITITPNGTDAIDGSNSTLILLPGETRLVTCNSTSWVTQVIVPFTLNITSTASPVLPRNGYTGFSGQLWGGGASGGTGATDGGGGGGGGAFYQFTYMGNSKLSVASLPLTLTVGAGGASQSTANTAGNPGGSTIVQETTNNSLFIAYGGGGGGGGSLGAGGGGGGIGGYSIGSGLGAGWSTNGLPASAGTGASAATTTAGVGGSGMQATAISQGGIAGGGIGNVLDGSGGGGGNATTKTGGGSISGGGGGGAAAATTGGNGGQSLWGGGGGAGASNATPGQGGISTHAGNGNAGFGLAPAGGGGGAVGTGSGGGASGQIILQGII